MKSVPLFSAALESNRKRFNATQALSAEKFTLNLQTGNDFNYISSLYLGIFSLGYYLYYYTKPIENGGFMYS